MRFSELTLASGGKSVDKSWAEVERVPQISRPLGAQVRGTWLWHANIIASDPSGVLAFASAHGINRIYLQFSASVPKGAYSSFILDAHQRGIEVDALGGEPSWALVRPELGVVAFLRRVTEYNQAEPRDTRFAGAHLDIEPYVLPEWQDERRTVIGGWMRAVSAAEDVTHQAGIRISLDLPFWLRTLAAADDQERLGTWMLEHADSCAIMAYRTSLDGANGIVAVAAPWLREAGRLGRPALVAVATSLEGEKAGDGFRDQKDLEACLLRLPRAFAHDAGFGGYAVHSLERWVRLARTGPAAG